MDQAERLRAVVSEYGEDIVKTTSSRVIAVTSGKGGVGKSNFTINLAVMLRRAKKNVVVIDTDFNMANVEVLFGVAPKYSLADVVNGTRSISEVITDGPLGIKFISAGRGVTELLKVNDAQMKSMIRNFILLDDLADVILIDTGPGVNSTVTNFVKASMETIIVTAPEPTSITDAYTLLKLLALDKRVVLPKLKIIVNRVESTDEGIEIFTKLKNVSKKFLEVDIELAGYLPFDQMLVKAVKRQEPVAIAFPNSKFSKATEQICDKFLMYDDINSNSLEKGFSGFMKRLVNMFNNN